MITRRPSNERGHFDHGWLNTYHTFSFSDYQDPNFMGFRSLRVINEDFVSEGVGFDTHGHRDMEIITYVLKGTLAHKDSMGNGSQIPAGDIQYMSAGKGVTHSEFNHSKEEKVHLLQIWILPDERSAPPRYDQKKIPAEEKKGKWRLLVSKKGDHGSIAIRQDANLSATILGNGEKISYDLKPGRYGWIQIAKGSASINSVKLMQGDGAAIENEKQIQIESHSPDTEILFFDLN